MQRITYMLCLVGEIETITATDLRKSPGDILVQASLGKVFTITKNGKPIAELGPIKRSD